MGKCHSNFPIPSHFNKAMKIIPATHPFQFSRSLAFGQLWSDKELLYKIFLVLFPDVSPPPSPSASSASLPSTPFISPQESIIGSHTDLSRLSTCLSTRLGPKALCNPLLSPSAQRHCSFAGSMSGLRISIPPAAQHRGARSRLTEGGPGGEVRGGGREGGGRGGGWGTAGEEGEECSGGRASRSNRGRDLRTHDLLPSRGGEIPIPEVGGGRGWGQSRFQGGINSPTQMLGTRSLIQQPWPNMNPWASSPPPRDPSPANRQWRSSLTSPVALSPAIAREEDVDMEEVIVDTAAGSQRRGRVTIGPLVVLAPPLSTSPEFGPESPFSNSPDFVSDSPRANSPQHTSLSLLAVSPRVLASPPFADSPVFAPASPFGDFPGYDPGSPPGNLSPYLPRSPLLDRATWPIGPLTSMPQSQAQHGWGTFTPQLAPHPDPIGALSPLPPPPPPLRLGWEEARDIGREDVNIATTPSLDDEFFPRTPEWLVARDPISPAFAGVGAEVWPRRPPPSHTTYSPYVYSHLNSPIPSPTEEEGR